MNEIKDYIDERQPFNVSTIASKEKIQLNIVMTIVVIVHLTALSFLYKNVIISFILGISIIIAFWCFEYIKGRLSSMTIKGEHLIIKPIKGNSTITSVRSIRKLSSTRIFDKQFVRVNYKLDGINKTVILIAPKSSSIKPDKALQEALTYVKNKRQIYKPGSVSQ